MSEKLTILVIICLIANIRSNRAEPLSPRAIAELPGLKLCEHPSAYGSCTGSVKMYYYDVEKKACLPFKYSGCGGHENKFEDEQSCKRRCAGLFGYF